jgi:hypothetical protein
MYFINCSKFKTIESEFIYLRFIYNFFFRFVHKFIKVKLYYIYIIIFSKFINSFIAISMNIIIRINKCNIFSRSNINSSISSCTSSLIFLMNNFNSSFYFSLNILFLFFIFSLNILTFILSLSFSA